MFKDLAGDDEIERFQRRRVHDVQMRLAVQARVFVFEKAHERLRDSNGVAHANPADVFPDRKLFQSDTSAEQLHGERVNNPAQAHVRSALVAARLLAIQRFRRAFDVADVAGETAQGLTGIHHSVDLCTILTECFA